MLLRSKIARILTAFALTAGLLLVPVGDVHAHASTYCGHASHKTHPGNWGLWSQTVVYAGSFNWGAKHYHTYNHYDWGGRRYTHHSARHCGYVTWYHH